MSSCNRYNLQIVDSRYIDELGDKAKQDKQHKARLLAIFIVNYSGGVFGV